MTHLIIATLSLLLHGVSASDPAPHEALVKLALTKADQSHEQTWRRFNYFETDPFWEPSEICSWEVKSIDPGFMLKGTAVGAGDVKELLVRLNALRALGLQNRHGPYHGKGQADPEQIPTADVPGVWGFSKASLGGSGLVFELRFLPQGSGVEELLEVTRAQLPPLVQFPDGLTGLEPVGTLGPKVDILKKIPGALDVRWIGDLISGTRQLAMILTALEIRYRVIESLVRFTHAILDAGRLETGPQEDAGVVYEIEGNAWLSVCHAIRSGETTVRKTPGRSALTGFVSVEYSAGDGGHELSVVASEEGWGQAPHCDFFGCSFADSSLKVDAGQGLKRLVLRFAPAKRVTAWMRKRWASIEALVDAGCRLLREEPAGAVDKLDSMWRSSGDKALRLWTVGEGDSFTTIGLGVSEAEGAVEVLDALAWGRLALLSLEATEIPEAQRGTVVERYRLSARGSVAGAMCALRSLADHRAWTEGPILMFESFRFAVKKPGDDRGTLEATVLFFNTSWRLQGAASVFDEQYWQNFHYDY